MVRNICEGAGRWRPEKVLEFEATGPFVDAMARTNPCVTGLIHRHRARA